MTRPSRSPRWSARLVSSLAVVASVAVVLSGCWLMPSGGSGPDQATDALVQQLESGGVSVVDEATVEALEAAPSVVVLSREQVATMSFQLQAGGGWLGRDLDALAGMPAEEGPALSFLLAGWARDHDGAGAVVARELLGEQEWSAPDMIAWTEAALSLFLADLTVAEEEDAASPEPSGAGSPDQHPGLLTASTAAMLAPAPQAPDVGSACVATADFVSASIARVYEAIQRAAQIAEIEAARAGGSIFGGVIGSVIGTVVGFAVTLFNEVVRGVVTAITTVLAPFITAIKTALSVIAVVQSVASAIRPWSLKLIGEPEVITAGKADVFGAATLHADPLGPLEPPSWLGQCLGALGFEMPERPGAGAPVAWEFTPGVGTLATMTGSEPELQDDRTARLDYRVNPEPPERWGGTPFELPITVRADVDQKKGLEPLQQLAMNLITGALAKLPSPISAIIGGLVASISKTALDSLASAIAASSSAVVRISLIYHDLKDREAQADPRFVAFCQAYAEHQLWLVNNQLAVIDQTVENMLLTEGDLVPYAIVGWYDMKERQRAVWFAAPPYLAPQLTVAMPFATHGTVYEQEVVASATRQLALTPLLGKYCPAPYGPMILAANLVMEANALDLAGYTAYRLAQRTGTQEILPLEQIFIDKLQSRMERDLQKELASPPAG